MSAIFSLMISSPGCRHCTLFFYCRLSKARNNGCLFTFVILKGFFRAAVKGLWQRCLWRPSSWGSCHRQPCPPLWSNRGPLRASPWSLPLEQLVTQIAACRHPWGKQTPGSLGSSFPRFSASRWGVGIWTDLQARLLLIQLSASGRTGELCSWSLERIGRCCQG